MNETTYLRAGIDDVEFAIPACVLIKIASRPLVAPVPDAPPGICGVAYENGGMYAIRSFGPKNGTLPQLVILCDDGSGPVAFAADHVDAMAELTDDDRAHSLPSEDMGILLLNQRETYD